MIALLCFMPKCHHIQVPYVVLNGTLQHSKHQRFTSCCNPRFRMTKALPPDQRATLSKRYFRNLLTPLDAAAQRLSARRIYFFTGGQILDGIFQIRLLNVFGRLVIIVDCPVIHQLHIFVE